MSFPFNSSFHANGNDFGGTESNNFSRGLDLSDSMATLHPDDYNGYYMSDTASVPSAALESLPSSSQQPSISYGGTTSDTSFREPDPFPSQDFPSHATTACAEDLLFFGDFTSNEPFNLPEGDILPKSPNENAASQLKTEQTRPERRNGVVGVPTINTHRGTAGSKSLVEARDDIMDFINVHLNKQECTSAHILRTKKAIDVLEELLKNYPSPGTESIVNDGGCLICGVTSPRFMNKGVLTRHVKDQHFPQFKHSCPKDGCTVTQHRKDKMKAHIRAHPGINPESFDTSEFPCPIQCPCCRLLTNGWEEFYTCIISHHKIGAPQSERAVSRNGSADHGQAPQMGSVTAVDPPPSVLPQGLTVPGSVPRERSPSSTMARDQLRPPRVRMNRLHSDPQLGEGNRLNSNSSRSIAHMGGQLPRGSPLPRVRSPYPQPTQRNEIFRERRLRQRELSSRSTRGVQCAGCFRLFAEGDLSECRLTGRSRYHCRGCLNGRSFGSSAVPTGSQDSQQSHSSLEIGVVSPLDTIFSPSPYWTSETFLPRQDMQSFPSTQFNQGQQNPGFSSRAAAPRSFQGSLPQGNDVNNPGSIWTVRHMRHIDSPTLSEEELSIGSPSSLGSILSPTSPLVSAFPWTKLLPIGLPTKPLNNLPTSPNPWLYSSFEVSPWRDIPPPPRLSQCRCACNTRVTKTPPRMTTDLSSGRPVKLRLSVATSNSPGSTLRNKVQIVVSLLSLRDTTKKRFEARRALEGPANKAHDDGDKDKDEDSKPDTKLVPLHSSVASSSIDMSLYDDQVIVPSDLPEMEFTFDLDTQASFDRISQLTGGLVPDLSASDDTYDPEVLEKARLLYYFARYVMFMITVLGRAADHEIRPQLRD